MRRDLRKWGCDLKIIAYDHPLIPAFKKKSFEKQTIAYKNKFEHLFFQNPTFNKKLQDYWTYYLPIKKHAKKRKSKPHWTLKIYLCLSPKDYWPTIHKLVKKLKKNPYHWKYYSAPKGYERPDKIVFYFGSGSELKKFVKKIRPWLPKSGFHHLSHTASTSEMGIEKKGQKGIHVGMDPPIGESWRMYRSHCIAWANINEEYLATVKGGKMGWYRRMNLSLTHEGPYSLNPSIKDIKHVQKYWKLING